MPALRGEGFDFMQLSFTSISSAAGEGEQALLIKISEQSHACRCLLCFGWKAHQTGAQTSVLEMSDAVSGI